MSDELGGSLFAKHLFSNDLFGGNPMSVFQETAKLYHRHDDGRLQFVESLAPGHFYETKEDIDRIRALYGAGSFVVTYMEPDGIKRRREFTVAPVPSPAPEVFVPGVPVPVPTLSPVFLKRLPLYELFSMLLSALGPHPLSPATARSVVDGWLSTLPLASTSAMQLEEQPDIVPLHPWMQLVDEFYDRTDTQIYREYVNAQLITDRNDLREYMMDGISRARVLCECYATANGAQIKQEIGRWYLWLDDERNPSVVLADDNGEACLGERYMQYAEADLVNVPWRWARTVEQAIWMVEAYGHPRVMGLDHDLGAGDTAMKFVRWLSDSGLHIPKWYVHSANPVGRENLISFMRSWERSLVVTALDCETITVTAFEDDVDANLRRLEDIVYRDEADDMEALNKECAAVADEIADERAEEAAAQADDGVMKV